jgi:ARG/rhodanese/phosphatase superfamily protein
MPDAAQRPLTLADHVPATLTLAAPDVVGALAVFPVMTDRRASLDFVSFAEGRAHGVAVKELPGGASVNDLIVHNPLDVAVLVYEGEEVVGAQQNRTFDISALVPARSSLQVPVSCVEAGRWDGARHAESFAPAPQAAYPELRRLKNRQVRQSLAAGGEARAQQGEVWREVAEKASRHGVRSQTGAMHDLFESRRTMLDSVQRAVTFKCSQVGMLAAIAGRFVVLDQVSNPDAFAALHGPLVQGYALDALESTGTIDPPSPSPDDACEFLALLLGAATTPTPAVGLGNGLQFEFGDLAGTGLAVDSELVTLTAFAQDGQQPNRAASAGRVRRPSRRRPR